MDLKRWLSSGADAIEAWQNSFAPFDQHPSLQISDEAGVLGAQLSSFSNLDASVVRLSALKAKFDPSLSLFADLILNPAFPQEDFARQQKLQLAAIQREIENRVVAAVRVQNAQHLPRIHGDRLRILARSINHGRNLPATPNRAGIILRASFPRLRFQ